MIVGKNLKGGQNSVDWQSGQRLLNINYSRTPVVISSASFKRYDLNDKEFHSKTISLAPIAGLARFIPAGLRFSPRRKDQ